MTLTRTFKNRPVTIAHDGGVVYVSVHDEAYLADRARWKVRLAEAHPDTGGTAAKFRDALRGYRSWQAKEQQWYETYGLCPPTKLRSKAPPAPFRRTPSSHQTRQARAEAGNCYNCGKPRGEDGSARMCRHCADINAGNISKFKAQPGRVDGLPQVRLSVKLTAEERLRWREVAESRGLSIESFVRATIREAMSAQSEEMEGVA